MSVSFIPYTFTIPAGYYWQADLVYIRPTNGGLRSYGAIHSPIPGNVPMTGTNEGLKNYGAIHSPMPSLVPMTATNEGLRGYRAIHAVASDTIRMSASSGR